MALEPCAKRCVGSADCEDGPLKLVVLLRLEVPVVSWDEVAPHEQVTPDHFNQVCGRYDMHTKPDEAGVDPVVLGVVRDDTDDGEIKDEEHGHVHDEQTRSQQGHKPT